MHARRSQCNELVTGADATAVDDAILLDDADAKSGQVENPARSKSPR